MICLSLSQKMSSLATHARFHSIPQLDIHGGPKTGPCLIVDNFATVSDRKAHNMSDVCTFFLYKV